MIFSANRIQLPDWIAIVLKYLKKVLKIIKNIAKEADAKGCIFKKLKEKFKSIK